MTLAEIIDLAVAEYGTRYQLTAQQLLQHVDRIQKIAFNRDLDAFLYWENYLTVLSELTLSASGYTPAVTADIGKTVTNGSVSGTLRYFNNTTRKWAVETSGSFPAGAALTITGGAGAGTLSSSGVYYGPYSWPSDPPVRKMLGLTRVTDAQLWNNPSLAEAYDYGERLNDYDPRRFIIPARKYDLERTNTFVYEPATDANTYRWVYYRRAPTISSEADDDKLLIPEEFHHTLIYQGVIALADNALYGDKQPQELLEPYLAPFWESMQQNYTPDGSDSANFTSEGQP